MTVAGTILVVEDDPDVLRALSFFLKNAGHTLLEASTGLACLELVKAEKPDLVLLDVDLPDLGGFEICRRIKGEPELAHTFVLFISGAYTSSRDQVQGLDAGADGYVVKSIHPQELVARVESLLRIAAAEKALRLAHTELEKRVAERTAALERFNENLLLEISQRRRVEDALRRNEERLRFLLTAAPAVIYSGKPSGDFECTFISEDVRNQLGYEPSDFTCNPRFWLENIHPEERARVLGGLGQLFQGGACIHEYRFRHKDGSYRWMRDEVRLIKDANDVPVELAGCWIDITARKEMEEALRSKTDQLQAITDTMTVYLRTGDWQQASATLLRSAVSQTASERGLVGLVVDGPTLRVLAQEGMLWNSAVSPDSSKGTTSVHRDKGCFEFSDLNNLFGNVVVSGRSARVNAPSADLASPGLPAGHPVLRSFLGVPILGEAEVVGMIGVANRSAGYTQEEQNKVEVLAQAAGVLYDSYRRQQRAAVLKVERRAAVEQVGESRRQYQELVESLDGIIWEADARSFQFTFVSQQCKRLLGYSVEQWMMQMTWEKLIHPDDLKSVLAVCQRAVKEKRNHSLEYRVLAADGRIIWVRDIATVVVKEGQPSKLIGVLLDVTERRTAEERLLTYQKKLRSLAAEMELAEERERRRIAADLHDHIGQNLAITKIKLDDLRENAAGTAFAQPLAELRDLIQQTIQDARSLLFEISPPVLDELGLGAALECLAEQFQAQHGIQIEFAEDRDPKPLPHDARAFLYKAVRELLLNVIKHAHARHARISLEREDHFLRVVVADDGQGFNAADLHSGSGKISGFGLFNLRERLDHNGGELMIDSSPNRGTRVTILAPLKDELTD